MMGRMNISRQPQPQQHRGVQPSSTGEKCNDSCSSSSGSYENDTSEDGSACDETHASAEPPDDSVDDTRAMFMKARMMSGGSGGTAAWSSPSQMAGSRSASAKHHHSQGSFQGRPAAASADHKQQSAVPKKGVTPSPPPSDADNANDMVYKALMEHKRQEMQRMNTLASDTRTITEAMLRKQVHECARDLLIMKLGIAGLVFTHVWYSHHISRMMH